MKVILAKNKESEFELDLPQFEKQSDLWNAMRSFKQKMFPNRNPRSSCFEFYLQFLPDTYTLADISPLKGYDKNYYIRKYGEDEGNNRWNEVMAKYKKRGTFQWFIDKYGEEEGPIKYKRKNSKLSVSEKSLKLNGYNDIEIKNIKKKHAERSKITLYTLANKYGEEEGVKRYLKYLKKLRENSYFTKSYWMMKGYTEIEAAEIIKKNSSHDLKFFIDKYGEHDGAARYEKMVKNQIWKSGSRSKPEEKIINILKDNNILFEDTRRVLSYFVDIYLPEYNTIIEFYGDYWHCNPTQWHSDDYHPTIKMNASEIWNADEKRINTLKSLGYQVIIIWESEFNKLTDGEVYENYIKAKINEEAVINS